MYFVCVIKALNPKEREKEVSCVVETGINNDGYPDFNILYSYLINILDENKYVLMDFISVYATDESMKEIREKLPDGRILLYDIK